MYIYPENLSAKPTLFLWQLRDVAILAAALVLSIFLLVKASLMLPLILTIVFAILSVRVDGSSILDFLRFAAAFFLTKQQYYEWRSVNAEKENCP